MCKGRLRKKMDQMRLAVKGRITQADRAQLQMLKEDILHYREQLKKVEEKIRELQQKFYKSEVELLEKVSGIGTVSGQKIIAEIGTDKSKFRAADHLTSWAGLAPGNNESAGKRKRTSTKKGNKHLRTCMIIVAWAAVRKKESYWSYQYACFRSKMPAKKAIVAIARKLLKLVYRILQEGLVYEEGGRKLYKKVQLNKNKSELKKYQVA